MLNLKPAPQAKALGQAERSSSQRIWWFVSIHCPCGALPWGGSQPITVSLIATAPGIQEFCPLIIRVR